MAETIGTLQIAEDPEAAGLDLKHAKAIAHAVRQGGGGLATKVDLVNLENRLTQRMAERANEAARRETRLLIAVIGTIGVAAAILGILIALT